MDGGRIHDRAVVDQSRRGALGPGNVSGRYLSWFCRDKSMGKIHWNELNRKVLRGKLAVCPRMEQVPVRLPEPSHSRTGSIYEVQSVLKRWF
jgi:hypothetical protein